MQDNINHSSVYYHITQEKEEFLTSEKLQPESVLFLLEKMKIYHENSLINLHGSLFHLWALQSKQVSPFYQMIIKTVKYLINKWDTNVPCVHEFFSLSSVSIYDLKGHVHAESSKKSTVGESMADLVQTVF